MIPSVNLRIEAVSKKMKGFRGGAPFESQEQRKRIKLSRILAPAICGWLAAMAADAALPVISNVTSQQRSGSKLVDISYDVADADGDALKVRVEISSDGGQNYSVPAFSFTGAIGDM